MRAQLRNWISSWKMNHRLNEDLVTIHRSVNQVIIIERGRMSSERNHAIRIRLIRFNKRKHSIREKKGGPRTSRNRIAGNASSLLSARQRRGYYLLLAWTGQQVIYYRASRVINRAPLGRRKHTHAWMGDDRRLISCIRNSDGSSTVIHRRRKHLNPLLKRNRRATLAFRNSFA